MIHLAGWCRVFVNDRVCGTSNHTRHIERCTKCMDESGFSSPHFSMKSKHFGVAAYFQQPGCNKPDLFEVKNHIHAPKISALLISVPLRGVMLKAMILQHRLDNRSGQYYTPPLRLVTLLNNKINE